MTPERCARSPTESDLTASLVGGRHRDAIGERAVIGQAERGLRLGQALGVRAELGADPVQRCRHTNMRQCWEICAWNGRQLPCDFFVCAGRSNLLQRKLLWCGVGKLRPSRPVYRVQGQGQGHRQPQTHGPLTGNPVLRFTYTAVGKSHPQILSFRREISASDPWTTDRKSCPQIHTPLSGNPILRSSASLGKSQPQIHGPLTGNSVLRSKDR